MIDVYEITGMNPDSGLAEKLYVTSGTHYYYGAQTYRPCVMQTMSFSQTLFAKGTTEGDVSVDYGDIVLNNLDGALDRYRKYGFDGQEIKAWRLQDEDVVLSDSNLYYKGTMLYAQSSFNQMTFYVRSRLQELDVAMQSDTFEGSNAGPTGFEGFPDDIGGRYKPRLWGRCQNVPMYVLNRSKNIYGCNFDKNGNFKPIFAFWNVYDKGGEYFHSGNLDSTEDLLLSEPDPGHYYACVADGTIRTGSSPNGPLTADAYESYGDNSSAPRVVRRILEDFGWVAGTDFDAGALDMLQVLNACPVQLYVTDELTYLDACVSLLGSIGAYMLPNSRGMTTFGRVDLPEDIPAAPVMTITDDLFNTGSIDRVMTGDDGKGIPAKRLILQHTKIWEVVRDALPSVPRETQLFLAEEWRSSRAPDRLPPVGTPVIHKLAPTLTQSTLLVGRRPIKLRNGDFSKYTKLLVPLQWDEVIGSVVVDELTRIATLGALGSSTLGQYMAVGSAKPMEIRSGSYTLEFLVTSGGTNLQLWISTVFDTGTSIIDQTCVDGLNTINFDLDIPTDGDGIYLSFRIISSGGADVLISRVNIYHKQYGLSPDQEASRRYFIQASDPERFKADFPYELVKDVFPGNTLILQIANRFDLSDGKKFLVIGRDEDGDDETVSLDFWG